MSRITFTRSALAAVAFALLAAGSPAAQSADTKVTQALVDSTVSGWKAEPVKTAKTIIAKYGLPQEVTSNRLIWHNNGPWKLTELVNEEVPHTFPMPHKDMLRQVINYRIDPDAADKLLDYDGSVIPERTKGELAARCDKEEANFLALNLADEVATGKRSVEAAREFYAQSVARMMKEGKPTDYMRGFATGAATSGLGIARNWRAQRRIYPEAAGHRIDQVHIEFVEAPG